MFDQLSDRLQATLSEVRSRGKLTEPDVDAAMREIRLALLEADVNFKVVKTFTADAQGALPRRRGAGEPRPRTAGGEDRQRGADGADGRGGTRARFRLQRPDRDPDGRPAGLRQDDRLRQARPLPRRLGQGRRTRRLRRLPARGDRPAGRRRASGPVLTSTRQGADARPSRDRRVGAGPGPRGGPRRADRRHRRPPPRRRGPDGRAVPDPQDAPSPTTCCWWSTR